MAGYATARDGLYRLVASYDATCLGDDRNGVADIVFPDIAHAADFVEVFKLSEHSRLRDPVRSFRGTVVVQIKILHAWAVIQNQQW